MDQFYYCQQFEQASNIIAPSPVSIHVMVVDDDVTSLSLVSSLLKTLNYQVASFNDPLRALYMLRAGKHSFDLILTALYMPNMDGFELTRIANDEFQLPVIMISTDDRESVMYRAIQEGVVLYLLKPFSPNDLRNIWQFAITTQSRSGKPKPNLNQNPNLFIEETRSHGVEFQAVLEAQSISSSNEVVRIPEKKKKKDSKGKGGNQEKSNDRKELTNAKKKTKVVWTDFLQYRFLQAVHYIGLEKAVPKKILQIMNVPSLTRENVASHLQKYRIFLRKVAERCMIDTTDKTTEEILWSKFLSRHASLVLQKLQQQRNFQHLNSSSQNPNMLPFSSPNNQTSNPSNGDRRSTRRQSSFARNLPPYFLGNPASFANFVGPLPTTNQNNAQAFNFSGPQIQNNSPLFENPYKGSNISSNNNNYYDPGFSVNGVGGGMSVADQKGSISNGFGEYGVGVGGDQNSYNWGLMCNNNNNGVNNFGGDYNSQISVRNSSHAHDNKDSAQHNSGFSASLFPLESPLYNLVPNQHQGGSGGLMYTADEESPTNDPFSIDDQLLDEFLASLLTNDTSA